VLTQEANSTTLFIGAGKQMSFKAYTIEILGKKSGSATLVASEQFKLTCNDAILLTVPDIYENGDVVLNMGFMELNGERSQLNGKKIVVFKVPPTNFQDISINTKPNL
jgi:hypothetical protein